MGLSFSAIPFRAKSSFPKWLWYAAMLALVIPVYLGHFPPAFVASIRYGIYAFSACATHGVLSGPAYDRIEESPIKEMVFLNTIPQTGNTTSGKIKFLDVSHVFARAIEHVHGGTSIADLF